MVSMNALKAVLVGLFGDDIELRAESFAAEHPGNPKFAGVHSTEVDGISLNVTAELVRGTPVKLLMVTTVESRDQVAYGRVGMAAQRAIEAEAEAKRVADEIAAAALAARRLRSTPAEFEITLSGTAYDKKHLDADVATYIAGDIVIWEHPRFGTQRWVVTGTGKEFAARDGKPQQRAYGMPEEEFAKLNDAGRDALPATAEEASAQRVERAAVNAKETRKAASALGGKALKGTPKQKEWAEKIRKECLGRVTEEVGAKLLSAAAAQTSKFWIENRTALAAGKTAGLL